MRKTNIFLFALRRKQKGFVPFTVQFHVLPYFFVLPLAFSSSYVHTTSIDTYLDRMKKMYMGKCNEKEGERERKKRKNEEEEEKEDEAASPCSHYFY